MSRKIALACLLLLAATPLSGQYGTRNGEWRSYAGEPGSTKYSPLDQINRSNVAQLKVAWRRPQAPPDIVAANPGLRLNNNYRATPIMVDGVLYASNGLGLAEAINPQTGATLWVQKPGDDPLRGAEGSSTSCSPLGASSTRRSSWRWRCRRFAPTLKRSRHVGRAF
jgi:quinoprotein glucose dehydrogenase